MIIPAPYIITTAEQSRALDAQTSDTFGIDDFTLMEVAGSFSAAQLIHSIEADAHGVFLCGKGNNGGDAEVVARYLSQQNVSCSIVFISGTDDLSASAQKNYELLQAIAEHDDEADLNFIDGWNDFDQSMQPDFIMDGMLGTGLDSDLRGDYAEAVQWTNQQPCTVFAMDIPTGLHADSGQAMGAAVKATQTFAFGTLKQGYYVGEGHRFIGNITYCELPFPAYLKRKSATYVIDHHWLNDEISQKARHKYEAGVLHIIAGSEGLTGAGIMAAESAWAEGIGAVVLVCPRGLLPIYETNLPHIIKKPVGARDDYFFTPDHLEKVQQAVTEKEGPVLIGSGMGREKQTETFVHQFLASFKGDSIIDADALWCLAQQKEWEKPHPATWILTPHPGELTNLLQTPFNTDVERLKQVRKMAQHQKITIVSKGFPVFVAGQNELSYMTSYDTRHFSRAGFGDVLAGKIGAFRAMGCSQAESSMRGLVRGNQKMRKLKQNNPECKPGPTDLI